MAAGEALPHGLRALNAFAVERVLSDGGEGGSINGARPPAVPRRRCRGARARADARTHTRSAGQLRRGRQGGAEARAPAAAHGRPAGARRRRDARVQSAVQARERERALPECEEELPALTRHLRVASPFRSGMEYGYYVGTTPRYGMLTVDVLCPDAIPGALFDDGPRRRR
jgi:hypothetical protein